MNRTATLEKKRILVVDDDMGILDALSFMLESSGFDVMTVARGDEAQAFANHFKPHVILLDLYLSGFDGRDIALSLKKSEITAHIPIIIISAHPTAGEALKHTAIDDFLPKPFDITILLAMIEKHLSGKKEVVGKI